MSNILELEKFLNKQTRPGLTQKVVTVHPSGSGRSPFQRRQWVRTGTDEKPEEEKQSEEIRDEYLQQILRDPSHDLRKVLEQENEIVDGHKFIIPKLEEKIKENTAELNMELAKPEDDQNSNLIVALKGLIRKDASQRDKQLNDIKRHQNRIDKISEELEHRKEKLLEEAIELPETATPEQRELTTGEPISSSNLEAGINKARIIELDNGKRGIFKPAASERHDLFEDIDGPLYAREVAAYELAKIIGMEELVPVTSIRTIDRDIGSIQEFVENAESIAVYAHRLEDIFELDAIQDCALLNALIGNEDRHGNNALIKDEIPVLIDHGFSFPNQAEPINPRSVFVNYLRENGKNLLRPDHLDLLQDFMRDKIKHAQRLTPYLSKRSIASIFVRAEAILNSDSYDSQFNWSS